MAAFTATFTRPLVYIHATADSDVTHGILPEFEAHVRQFFDIITCADLEENDSTAEEVAGAILFGARMRTFLSYLPAFTKLRVVASFGTGTNHLDLARFSKLGVRVSNTPDVLNDAMAEMTLTLMLAAARSIVPGDRIVRETVTSEYDLNDLQGVEVKGSTVGIVGMGSIGLTVAHLLRALGANIVYHNRNRRCESDEMQVGATYYATLDAMLPQCDFILLLCPLTAATRGLISMRQLAAMKRTATLVNVSRGPVVDTDALVEALRTKQIRAAALDVTDPEPLPVGHALRSLGNVVMTPHWGSQTFATRFAMFRLCVDNLRAVLIDNAPMPSEVSMA